jgi:hypothetical protein
MFISRLWSPYGHSMARRCRVNVQSIHHSCVRFRFVVGTCLVTPRLMRCWQVIIPAMLKATFAASAKPPRSDFPSRLVKEDPCSPQAMCQCALCDSMCYMRLQANSVYLRMPLVFSLYYVQLGNRLSVRPIIMV